MPAPANYAATARSAAKFARRAAPVAMDLYRRWQALPPAQRERYLKMVREYADRAAETARRRPAPRRRR
ncbi:MAG: hypothetical protein QOJ07_562 [Thermoleophilaceae bacterium]|jgi:hypothetical protein|nr:hypothetical protein [Thermoleophilaceae bacterium]